MDVESLLSKMTLAQKLCQLTQFASSTAMMDPSGDLTGPQKSLGLTQKELSSIGSVLGTGSCERAAKIQKQHMDADELQIPLVFMRDVIHGWRTVYPIPLAMAASWDPELLQDCCAMAAREAVPGGIQMTFSPMADLVRDARWGRVMESSGEDPCLNSAMTAAAVRGYHSEGLASCVKHFGAYGATVNGRDYYGASMGRHDLQEFYLRGYHAAVGAGAEAVMPAFNTIDGTPATGNHWLLQEVLRRQWGFEGVVISDWGAVAELQKHGFCEDAAACAETAMKNGVDMEMESVCYMRNLEKAVADGVVSEADIDAAVRRILKLKEKAGLLDDSYSRFSPEQEKALSLCPAHRALARKAAAEAAVLLKNEGVLPMPGSVSRVAVLGPFADRGMLGSWACGGKAEEAVSVYEGLCGALGAEKCVLAQGCGDGLSEQPQEALLEEAVLAAKSCEYAVLCVGESSAQSGEGQSRAELSLSPAQRELIFRVTAANPNTVVLLFTGRPLVLTDVLPQIPALAVLWQPGTEGGNAAADLLLGKVNFSGRLPMTFPASLGQVPIYYNQERTARPKPTEDSTVGFVSRYLDAPNAPLFCFGFGLSYTSFSCTDPVLSAGTLRDGETIRASVTVKNTGSRAGSTVLQLYLQDECASVVRPMRELKGFRKIFLQPGEEQEIGFDIGTEQLAFFTADGSFRAEPGWFRLWISENACSGEACRFRLER